MWTLACLSWRHDFERRQSQNGTNSGASVEQTQRTNKQVNARRPTCYVSRRHEVRGHDRRRLQRVLRFLYSFYGDFQVMKR
jgi:hypothetical protein